MGWDGMLTASSQRSWLSRYEAPQELPSILPGFIPQFSERGRSAGQHKHPLRSTFLMTLNLVLVVCGSYCA